MPTLDPMNYILDFDSPEFFESPQHRKWFREAPEPVFEDMQGRWWFHHFVDAKYEDLLQLYRALELPPNKVGTFVFPPPVLVHRLVEYFQGVVSNAHTQ